MYICLCLSRFCVGVYMGIPPIKRQKTPPEFVRRAEHPRFSIPCRAGVYNPGFRWKVYREIVGNIQARKRLSSPRRRSFFFSENLRAALFTKKSCKKGWKSSPISMGQVWTPRPFPAPTKKPVFHCLWKLLFSPAWSRQRSHEGRGRLRTWRWAWRPHRRSKRVPIQMELQINKIWKISNLVLTNGEESVMIQLVRWGWAVKQSNQSKTCLWLFSLFRNVL